jgi:hypothetical protein
MVIAQDRLIEALKLTTAKLRHEKYGASSERGGKFVDPLELQLADLGENVAEDEIATEPAGQAAEPSRAALVAAVPCASFAKRSQKPTRMCPRASR